MPDDQNQTLSSIQTQTPSPSEEQFHIVLPLEPVAKGRPRMGKHGAYTPKKTRASEAEIKYFLYQANPPKFTGAIKASMGFGFPRPKTVKEKKRPYMIVKPDLDNLIKTLGDACNGILWDDDSQIVDLRAYKFYSAAAQIILAVEPVRQTKK